MCPQQVMITVWDDEYHGIQHEIRLQGLTMTTRQCTLIKEAIRSLYNAIGEDQADEDK